ncbi:aliphatic sulfonate ABC transporter substrate-binding protein [Sporosarcina sp. Te-1]|uniref:aliphatic sulfonate ABC transporter substrate-binding protein n=1 Tax=Sporosarcina sp. Te-1 TaxID=2818390 RepID=UPI001A9F5E51|nr:aliphatic sulfonate ABC transporter substrate-binding protein [Sporosarcina sp. Te-1]QTD40278.1 aliphatic sulfonate ABC transporter substrate-binding protein [Sporosarcina sp. Te-1]
MKRWIVIVIAGALALLLSACGKDESTEKANASDKVVRIGFQKGNTLNILKESGFLEKKLEPEGYVVEWKEFVHGGTLLEGLFTGHIDFGHAADGSGINAQAGNKPFVYVGADLPNPEGVGILVHQDSGISSIAELKGKKIGVLKGGNHHYLAILAIKDAGLALDDVEWVYLQDASQQRTAFETKKIDALATYDPFFAGVEVDLKTVNLTDGKDYGYPNRTFYYANEKFYNEHPELVDLILEATDESDQWANKHKEEVVTLVSKMLGIDEHVIERAVSRREYAVERISDEIIEVQQKQADVYYEIGLIPNEINIRDRVPEK